MCRTTVAIFISVFLLPAAAAGLDAQGSADPAAGKTSQLPLQTSSPGVFAIGDARGGSVKRVAAGVGEGAAVVAQIHSYLAASRP